MQPLGAPARPATALACALISICVVMWTVSMLLHMRHIETRAALLCIHAVQLGAPEHGEPAERSAEVDLRPLRAQVRLGVCGQQLRRAALCACGLQCRNAMMNLKCNRLSYLPSAIITAGDCQASLMQHDRKGKCQPSQVQSLACGRGRSQPLWRGVVLR